MREFWQTSGVLALSALLLTTAPSCVKEGADGEGAQLGVATQLPVIWRAHLTDSGSRLKRSLMKGSLPYDNGLVVLRETERGAELAHLDAQDGSEQWTWQDFYPADQRGPLQFETYYRHDHLLLIAIANRRYVIDLNTGRTVRREEVATRAWIISGYGDRYFVSGTPGDVSDSLVYAVYTGTLSDPGEELLFKPAYRYQLVDAAGIAGDVGAPLALVDDSGDVILGYGYGNPISSYDISLHYGSYNLTQGRPETADVLLEPSTFLSASGPFELDDYRAFHQVNEGTICVNHLTGERIYRVSALTGLFAPPRVFDGRLIISSEDTYLYAFDAATGQQLWREKSSGTTSPLAYLNGVIYYTGGGDGLLHAVDAATGEHLWKVRSPDQDRNAGSSFSRRVTVVEGAGPGGGGLVVAETYLAAVAYAAAR